MAEGSSYLSPTCFALHVADGLYSRRIFWVTHVNYEVLLPSSIPIFIIIGILSIEKAPTMTLYFSVSNLTSGSSYFTCIGTIIMLFTVSTGCFLDTRFPSRAAEQGVPVKSSY